MLVPKKLFSIFIILAILAVLLIYVTLYKTNTEAAYLIIDEGTVEMNKGRKWEEAINHEKLSLTDKIRTNDGQATLVFYDSIIVNLERDTEIEISELSKDKIILNQQKGTIWNTFTDIFGIGSYEVITPKARATVRGTDFGIEVASNQESFALIEGKVDVNIDSQKVSLDPLNTLQIDGNSQYKKKEMTVSSKRRLLYFIKDNLDKLIEIKGQQENEKKLLKFNTAEVFELDTPVLSKHRRMTRNIERLEALVKCLECQEQIEQGNFNIDESDGDDPYNFDFPELQFNLNNET